MPLSRIFRSRWSALFWAGGIVWTAYDVASGQPDDHPASNRGAAHTDATGERVDPAGLAVLANAMR
ncbi:hypothetical protein [Sphingomonas bacterium]|uniref:hypothetical protein n=1 Tax=Sphingomonas bacterium TaxID=1895847 RepID=UPI001577695F|nr:hypothetical protein [Sphingomonas bacterium]